MGVCERTHTRNEHCLMWAYNQFPLVPCSSHQNSWCSWMFIKTCKRILIDLLPSAIEPSTHADPGGKAM